ncbi:MAG: DUF2934 domain-containing protein [Phycisphaerales bacterium]|nr:DUF2934 domain-containing protein [Phycisphaerales bacterium]
MSSHTQSHQYQPHNPSSAVQPSQARQSASSVMPEASKPKASAPTADVSVRQPSAEHIRARAYEISQARNGEAGNATSDWCQAETELSAASTIKA